MRFFFLHKPNWFLICLVIWVAVPKWASAQNDKYKDTFTLQAASLDSISVTAFRNQVLRMQQPASVAVLLKKELSTMGEISVLPSFNQIPGVKMEERSPGSYRLSIRGSLLRSPFGVRNVKIYLNQIPLTDAGGNTYLNAIPAGMLERVEIIKGPAASVYGAGTGGVLLLQSGLDTASAGNQPTISASLVGGSFGLLKESLGWNWKEKKSQVSIYQDHQRASGYREQSAFSRDALAARILHHFGKQSVALQLLYSNLFYQTPGGLTLSQFLQNPTSARPATATIPGAVSQNSSVANETYQVSLSHVVRLVPAWQVESFIMSGRTNFTNPFITNYEQRKENNLGWGTQIRYTHTSEKTSLEWITGIEWLRQSSRIDNFGNRFGKPDTLQFSDELRVTQWYGYTQINLQWKQWIINAGVSINQQPFLFQRVSQAGSLPNARMLPSFLAPRFSLSRKLLTGNVYLLVSRGFSPPTVAELRPSDGNYYGSLTPENGWNLEMGWRAISRNRRWLWDASFYRFSLLQTIVRRNNAAGAEYFVNTGSTLQQGIETSIQWKTLTPSADRKWEFSWQTSFCFQPYYFVQYQQGSANYSGNALTGIPRTIVSTGLKWAHQRGWFLNTLLLANAAIPLNDASDEYAKPYQLLQAEGGFRLKRKSAEWHFFAGADNLLNQQYSLGNDINAAGRRYYNAAAGYNGFAGIRYRCF